MPGTQALVHRAQEPCDGSGLGRGVGSLLWPERHAEEKLPVGVLLPDLPHHNFTISFHSDIPRLVGLSGSSAIIAATMRAMLAFYQVDVEREALVNLVWSAERDELVKRHGYAAYDYNE